MLILAHHSPWLTELISKTTQETLNILFSSFTLTCLVIYIMLEIGKIILIYDIYLHNLIGNLLWMSILTICTVYTSLVRKSSISMIHILHLHFRLLEVEKKMKGMNHYISWQP